MLTANSDTKNALFKAVPRDLHWTVSAAVSKTVSDTVSNAIRQVVNKVVCWTVSNAESDAVYNAVDETHSAFDKFLKNLGPQ
jgi:hypothetical protein